MSGKWAVSGFAIFIGLICLIYRMVMASKLKTHVRASGRVLSCEAGWGEGSGFKTVFLVATGSDATTGEVTGVECTVQTNHGYEIGDIVPVLHPEKFPSHGTIYEPFIHKLFGSWLLWFSGGLLLIAQLGFIPDD